VMTAKNNPSTSDAWYVRPADKTSLTDDQRIQDITVLPRPNTSSAFFRLPAPRWRR